MKNMFMDSNWINEYNELAKNPSIGSDDLWNSFKFMLHDLRNKLVPLIPAMNKQSWKNKGSIPLDEETRKAIRCKEKSHRKWMDAIKSGLNDSAKYEYIKARNKAKLLLRRAKRKFERGIALEAKTNPKHFWSHARRNLKTKSGIAPLLNNPKDMNSMTYDDEGKAEILSRHYSSIFTKEDINEIPKLKKRAKKSIKDLFIDATSVAKSLKLINPNKSCGPDDLHPQLLIELADLIAEPLTLLLNFTLQTKKLPTDWKRAYISPIFKKGFHHLAENYRPISLTAIISKVMENLFVTN